MRPIRNAAHLPLLSLAPRRFDAADDQSLASGLGATSRASSSILLVYTRAASVVTVNQGQSSAVLVANRAHETR